MRRAVFTIRFKCAFNQACFSTPSIYPTDYHGHFGLHFHWRVYPYDRKMGHSLLIRESSFPLPKYMMDSLHVLNWTSGSRSIFSRLLLGRLSNRDLLDL